MTDALPRLALGSWHTWDRMSFQDRVDVFLEAVRSGASMFDVGSYNFGPYAEGSETDVLFGRIARESGVSRDAWTLSVKLWLWEWPRESFVDQLDRAYERIGYDRAELVVLGDFYGELDVARVVEEIGELLRAGRIGAWGVNNWSAQDIAQAHDAATARGLPGPAMAQLKYSVCRRAVAEGAPWRTLMDERGIRLQASDVFEGGILAGGRGDARPIGSDAGDIRKGIRAVTPQLAEIAAGFDATLGQLSLAFCLANPDVACVLFGVSRVEQLRDNLGAVELAAEHGAELRKRLERFWLDRGVVDPSASWATSRDAAVAATPEW